MFKIFNRKPQAAASLETEQHMLDTLRYHNADNPHMQLHLDRMQTALNRSV